MTAPPDGRGPVRSVLEEEREFFLRSLRDLEVERAAGDIDEVDYQSLRDDYTIRAAEVVRQLGVIDGRARGPAPLEGSSPEPEPEPASLSLPARREPSLLPATR